MGHLHQPAIDFVMLRTLQASDNVRSLAPAADGRDLVDGMVARLEPSDRWVLGRRECGRPGTGLHLGILTASLHEMNPADVAEHAPLPYGRPAAISRPVRNTSIPIPPTAPTSCTLSTPVKTYRS